MRKPGVWQELRRRNVLRATVLYAGAVWALSQGVSQLTPALGLPDFATRWFLIACVIGFPLWLAFAWFYEFTPQGFRRESEVAADSAVRHSAARQLDFAIIAVLVIAVALLASGYFVKRKPAATLPATGIAVQSVPAKSIAVLPFENLSDDKNNAYFVAGMQDLILTKLADIGDLKVIARTSTEQYTSHPGDLAAIARRLGVATILEGSVQKSGKQVLINVQLIDANTDAHIWAQSYTRTLDNIFGVEGEVADKVANALNAKLTQAEAARVAAVPTTNAAAYDAYLRGEYHMAKFNRGEMKPDVAAAVQEYSDAVRQDPGFALAWARLANAQVFLGAMIHDDSDLAAKLFAEAKTSTAQALALQPDLAEAWVSQGISDIWPGLKLQGALKAFQKALALQPQNANALWFIAFTLRGLDKTEESIRALRELQVIDPQRALTMLGGEQAYLHHFADAQQTMKRMLAIDPDSWVTLDSLASLYAYLGDLPSMRKLIEGASASIKSNPNFIDTIGDYLFYRRDWAAARKLYAHAKETQNFYAAFYPVEIKRGDVEWYAGNQAAAREQYQRAVPLLQAQLQQNPKTWRWHAELGWVYARLGRDDDALQQGRLALGEAAGLVRYAPLGQLALARIEAQVGKADDAVASLDILLGRPTGIVVSVPLLKMDPTWDPIRKDPRFQALLKKYSQHEPSRVTTSEAGDE